MIGLTVKFDVSLFVFLIIVLLVPNSFAESNDIPITLGNQNIEIDFDGKWSFTAEWKASSLNEIKTDLGPIYLRTFHLHNFIYIMIDAVADKTIDKGYDKATICFDSKNEKSITPDENDYYFSVTLGKKSPTRFRGNQQLKEFEIIDNPSWPFNLSVTSKNYIPNPNECGIIFSPDKSLPEYELPIIVLVLAVLFIVLVSSKSKNLDLFYYNR